MRYTQAEGLQRGRSLASHEGTFDVTMYLVLSSRGGNYFLKVYWPLFLGTEYPSMSN